MRKLVVTALAVMGCGLYALPLGNPGEASLYRNGIWCESSCTDVRNLCFNWCNAWSLRAGFNGNYVFNRHIKVDNKHALENTQQKALDRVKLFTNSGYLALNICDRLDLFTSLGVTKISLDFNQQFLIPLSPFFAKMEWASTFSWSVGGRATLWQCDCFIIGLEGEYFQTTPDFSRMCTFIEPGTDYVNIKRARTKYKEWQVGVGAAYRIVTSCPRFAMVPYIGVTWSDVSTKAASFPLTEDLEVTLPNLSADTTWAFVVGNTFMICEMAGVSVEGRFGGESAVAVRGQARF